MPTSQEENYDLESSFFNDTNPFGNTGKEEGTNDDDDDEKWMESDNEDEENDKTKSGQNPFDEYGNAVDYNSNPFDDTIKNPINQNIDDDDIKSNIGSILSERSKLNKANVQSADEFMDHLEDDETKTNVSKHRSRSEERAALLEISGVVHNSSSSTMEYENSDEEGFEGDDDDESDVGSKEDGSARTSKSKKKKKKPKTGSVFSIFTWSSKVDKIYNEKSNSDPYLGLDADDGMGDDGGRRERLTPSEERMKKMVGPFVWQHRNGFRFSLYFGIASIAFLIAMLVLLKQENKNLFDELEENKDNAITSSPTIASVIITDPPSMSPSINFTEYVNGTNKTNEMLSTTPPSIAPTDMDRKSDDTNATN